MIDNMDDLKVSIIQNSASDNIPKNLQKIDSFFDVIMSKDHPDIICLPEVFYIRGKKEAFIQASETIPGKICCWLSTQAKKYKVAILAGSIVEKYKKNIYNTTLFFDKKGMVRAKYRKIHLFSSSFSNGPTIDESQIFHPGKQTINMKYLKWNFGFSICYDLRFPELFRRLSKIGADIIFVPSNFTYFTGKAHWKTLLKARAIENQCYIVAPNQCGISPGCKTRSYGHSVIIDPWGSVLVEAKEKEAYFTMNLSMKTILEIRNQLPALKNRIL